METDTLERIDVSTDITDPSLYNVVLLNDDVTPFDFVVMILVEVVNLSMEEALRITAQINEEDSGIVATDVEEIAEAIGELIVRVSRANGYPLQVEVVPSDE